jgi:hypothetical protein
VSKRTLDQCPIRHPNQEGNQEGNQEERTPVPPSPKTAKPAAQPPTAEELSYFDRFWLVYPRKDAKAKAAKAWKSAKIDNIADLIIADVTRRRIDDSQWADPHYIPYPATYINQRRWEDEIPTAQPGAKNARQTKADSTRDILMQLADAAGYLGAQEADGRVVLEVPFGMGQ